MQVASELQAGKVRMRDFDRAMKQRIRDELQLTASVGIAAFAAFAAAFAAATTQTQRRRWRRHRLARQLPRQRQRAVEA